MEEKNMNVFQKMSIVTDEIKRVPKNLTIGTGKFQYKAVAEADILSAVKDAERNVGIFSYPANRSIIESRTTAKDNGGESQFVRVETTYRFVNMDNPTDYIEVKAYGDGVDTLDKAPGKATTYADKYALMKAYKIETGDDIDGKASDDLLGHDVFKVKQRIEKKITSLMQKGMSEQDIMSAMNLNAKQYKGILSYPETLGTFEKKLDGLNR